MDVANDEQNIIGTETDSSDVILRENLIETSKDDANSDSKNESVMKSELKENGCNKIVERNTGSLKDAKTIVAKDSNINSDQIYQVNYINGKTFNNASTESNNSIRSKITFESDVDIESDDEYVTLTEFTNETSDMSTEISNNENCTVDSSVLRSNGDDHNPDSETTTTLNETVKAIAKSDIPTETYCKLTFDEPITTEKTASETTGLAETVNNSSKSEKHKSDNGMEPETHKNYNHKEPEEHKSYNHKEPEILDNLIKIEVPIEDTEQMTSDEIKMLQLNLRPRRVDKRKYADLSETSIERKLKSEYKQKIRELKQERWARSKRNNQSNVGDIKAEDIDDNHKKPISKSKKKIILQNKHQGLPYFCNLCDYISSTIQGYNIHMRNHDKIKCRVFTCPICSQEFGTNGQLVQHKTTHGDETYLCNKCEVAFSNYDDWAIHKVIHTNTYKCGQCQMKFSKGNLLALHIPSHTRSQEKCNVCGKLIIVKYMEKHLKSHKEPGFECVECGRKYPEKKSLEYHMVSHTGLKLFQCWYCGKGFSNAQQRTTHMRLHTGEKPYKCSYCEEVFNQATDKKRHEYRHLHDGKKFECDICHRKFFEKGHIRQHMRMHINYRPYSCVECSERFLSLAAYKFHMDGVHLKLKEAYCDVCDMRFNNKSHLTRHFKRSKSHRNKVFLKESGEYV